MQKKYIQLYSILTDAMSDGTYSSGDKLPTELELATKYSMSRQTVRQALELLERNEMITKVQGSGSYVSSKAKSLKKTMRIAVITTYISTYIFPDILRGIEEVTTNSGYSLQLMATNNSIAKERDILQFLSNNVVDGIIVEGTKTALPNPNLHYYQEFACKSTPLVFFNGYYPTLLQESSCKIITISTDDYGGAHKTTTDLIQRGHHLLGGVFKSDDIQGVRRFSGYVDALTDANLRIDDDHIIWFNTESKYSPELKQSLNRLATACTAIVCYNDEIAFLILAYLNSNPSSVTALRSFDGTITGRQNIDFVSYGHPKEALGRQAAEHMIALMTNKPVESLVMDWDTAEK
ncbi:MAG: GntR family transcriptional regulator [Candidatus Saccharimonadaceae bacterium]|nr:GntR family transcriptional regulator [Candidatus Saccharimonadaceae bacterium]